MFVVQKISRKRNRICCFAGFWGGIRKRQIGMLPRYFRSIGSQSPPLIPSVLGETGASSAGQDLFRTRRIQAAALSILFHSSILWLAFLLVHKNTDSLSPVEKVILINAPFFDLPNEGEGNGSGRSGGGGMRVEMPPARGGMPDSSRQQLLPPDPKEPQAWMPADDTVSLAASIEMPMETLHDPNLPIGDISAPYNTPISSGPGQGGGIGENYGIGVGSDGGPGYRRSRKGGSGRGNNDGLQAKSTDGVYDPRTSGLKAPAVLLNPDPDYTEEARKLRIEGSVLIQAIVRKDGSVDGFQIIRSLGHGLDASAVQTIGAKWRFKPAQLNGVPVDVRVDFEVSFHLH